MTDWPELYKSAPTYAKLTPPRVYSARERAERLYRVFDALVDKLMTFDDPESSEVKQIEKEIEVAKKNYQQADDKYMSIKHAYLADPHPEDWFSAPTPVVMPQEVPHA